MISEALQFLIQSIGGFFAGLFLLRFWMQWCRAPARNPLSEFVQTLTHFAVLPARRIIPGLWGMDLATLVLAWLVLIIEALLMLAVKGLVPGIEAMPVVALLALVMLLRLAIYLAIGAIILLVIISWVNPASPMYSLIQLLTRPLLGPIQRVVPPIGMVDLSPLIALLLLQLLLMVPLAYLERMIGALL